MNARTLDSATDRHRFVPVLALATAGCLWGTGFLFGKIALSEMPVASMVLFRFTFGCIALLPSFLASRPQFSASEWGMVFAASLLGVPVQYLVQFKDSRSRLFRMLP
jgi:drug/metabolite transporter (DMT)-like permease